jgi:hypothetical protein
MLIVVAVMACLATPAWAQRRVPHFQRTPRLSPYVQLFRGDTGGLNSYYQFVRPQQDYQNFFNQQMLRNQRYDRAIYGSVGSIYQMGATLPIASEAAVGIQQRPASATALQPRPPATFMNLDHYYPAAQRPVTGTLRRPYE